MAEQSETQSDQKANSIGDVVDGIEEVARSEDEVSINDLLEEFGSRSFAPFLLILSLVGMTPVGGIPGVPSFIAACLALVAGQLAIGRTHIWMPAFIADRSVGSEKLSGGTDKLERVASVLDRLAKGRLKFLTRGPAMRIAGGVIIALCCAVPFLEFVPFAAAFPFLSIAILSLSIMVRDGLVMVVGGVSALAALGFGLYWAFA